MKLLTLKFTTPITTTDKRCKAYILVYTPTPTTNPAPHLKTYPTADWETFHIPHITHRSAVIFCTFHSAFYLPHSACHNSAFY